jgi:hypothetical protein
MLDPAAAIPSDASSIPSPDSASNGLLIAAEAENLVTSTLSYGADV